MSELNFDANQHEPNKALEALPAGTYDVIITESVKKPTNDGTGQVLNLVFQVLNGPHQNRKLYDRLNIVNNGAKKEMTERIALGSLSAICRAVNVLTPKDSTELHDKPLRVKVVVKADPMYGPKNEIKGYMPKDAGPVMAPVSAPAAAPATSNARPWG